MNNYKLCKIFCIELYKITRKQQVCELMGLDPANHRFYKTDWLQEPTHHLSKEEKSLLDNEITPNDLLILRDNESVNIKLIINKFKN